MPPSPSPANIWVLLGLGVAGIILMARKLKRAVKEDLGAFVERLQLLPPPQPPTPKAPHPLTGLSFAVGDVFDIAGYVTGFGNPYWARTHEAVVRTAWSVSAVVEGGATCIGKTIVSDMAFGINGENKHYGTPTNPAAHPRVPGGSCSGSAVAVAAGFVDFSLGIDTTGGMRVPGGFCGILGFRPSYGAVSTIGVIPVLPSLDTIGLFARDPSILCHVGHVLLQLPYADSHPPRYIIIADDCFELLKIPKNWVTQVVIRSMEKLFGISSLKQFQSNYRNGELKKSSLRALATAMQLLQKHEFKSYHGEWINSTKPVVDPIISAYIHSEPGPMDADIDYCRLARDETRSAVNSFLKDDGILVVPTIADPPKLGSKEMLSEHYQTCAFSLLAIASMSGCCQVTVPLGSHERCPVLVSFIARHGGDRFLLSTVHAMYTSLQAESDIASKSNLSSNVISQEESAEIAKEKNVKAFLRRGMAREMLGYYKEAIEDFGYAFVLEPTNKMANLAVNRLRKLFQ